MFFCFIMFNIMCDITNLDYKTRRAFRHKGSVTEYFHKVYYEKNFQRNADEVIQYLTKNSNQNSLFL